jgi:hypothetical protein
MNTIETLIARIEECRATNKQPCKNYGSKEAAEKATAKMAQDAANHFDAPRRADAPSARYVVFYNEAWGRWVGAIDLTELLARKTSTGGYLGICSAKGFYSF